MKWKQTALLLAMGTAAAVAQHRPIDAARLKAYGRSLPQVHAAPFGVEQATSLAAWPLACVDHPQAAPEGAQYLWLYGEHPALPANYDKTRAFYGCYDWHSAVNSSWVMVALSKDYPELQLRRLIQEKLTEHLGAKNIAGELEFFKQAKAFERPYGYAWLLKLHAELSTWNDPEAPKLTANVKPLRDFFSGKLVEYYDHLPMASRTGVHPNTAMSMMLTLDALQAVPDEKLKDAVYRNAKRLFQADADCPTAYEPGGTEFLSPCLTEAQLMSRILSREEFSHWLADFLPPLDAVQFQTLAKPVDVSGITDKEEFAGKSHLIGLAFDRAYAMTEIADALPENDPRIAVLRQIAAINAAAGFKALPEAGYLGSHWLGTYAVLALRASRHVSPQPSGPAHALPPADITKPQKRRQHSMNRLALPIACTLLLASVSPLVAQKKKPVLSTPQASAAAAPAKPAVVQEKESFLENPWQQGMLLQDTNGDKIADAVCGHVIVATNPSAAENTAAANIAARIGYETSAMSLPLVIQGTPQAVAGCSAGARNIWIGEGALPAGSAPAVHAIVNTLGLGEGAVVAVDGGIAIVGPDPVGLLTAANAYAERAPYLWNIPGDKIGVTAKNVHAALLKTKSTATVELQALIFAGNNGGVRRAVLKMNGTMDAAAFQKLMRPEEGTAVSLGSVREAQIVVGETPLVVAGTPASRAAALPAMPEGAADARPLDLARLYTIKGLLTGSAKKPIPSGTVAKLYVPAGAQGVAMANLAARIGLETVGITLPIALPESGVTTSQVQGTPVIAEGTPAADHLRDLLVAKDNVDLDKLQPGGGKALAALPAGEGELRVVEHAAGKGDALLVRGDGTGAAAALQYATDHLPYLWEANKRYASVEEVRDDLRHFFGQKSDVGQAASALYHLDQWSEKLAKDHPGGLSYVRAEVDVDEVDPKLNEFIRSMLSERLHTSDIEVVTGSKHAGVKCCDGEVPMHLQSEVAPFKQAAPTFAEDLTFEWEGKRMLAAALKLAAAAPAGQPVVVQAGVSESPEQRKALAQQLKTALDGAGVKNAQVEVLSAYKQGYSWLVDSIEPALTGKHVEKITVEFAPYRDPKKVSTMRTEERWIQELYPVDEILSRDLKLPLTNVTFKKMESDSGPTYRVHAYDKAGKEVLTGDFTAHMHERPYSTEFQNYEKIGIETGWVTLTGADGKQIATERIPTDTEMFWEHYQDVTMPKIIQSVLVQNEGKPKLEYQPLFDTIKVDFHMSEPDYGLGLDQERISSLEGLQEDLLFATQNSFYIFGNTFSTGIMDYMGRIVPIAHLSSEGKDPHVRVEFYETDAAHPQVKLAWSASDVHDEWKRDLPALAAGDPRLVAVRVHAGSDSVDQLTWSLPVASNEDKFEDWRNLVTEDSLEHTVLSAEQAKAQLSWLQKMHAAGLYTARLSYPHLKTLDFEFSLPLDLRPAEHTKAATLTAEAAVIAPPHARPQITDVAPAEQKADKTYVQWDQPIGLDENARLLSRLSTFPGVNVYWMGRSYMGNNIWAADVMLPTPSALRSMAKETTLKAAIVYSGRQHANEVSSTSHIQKFAEELVLDPTRRKSLDKVNVVIHPVTNPDGAELAMDLAKVTPDNMLHAGYHASLTADMITGLWDQDPVYPESRTRRQLWEAWLPDGFLNPHGYPSHEWVQPFSEYSAWVISRTGAELGRAWWAPRGWFTSLYYFNDEEHPQSKTVNYTLRDYIVDSMGKAPGVLDMNARMNARYFRYGQQWDQRAFQQPIYKGVRVYMAVTGQQPGARSSAFSARFPDVTYDDGYTEAPDETARGPWLHLVAGAGLAYDHAHLQFLSDGKFKIKRTQKEFFDGVQWSVNRDRPVLPEVKTGTTDQPAVSAAPTGNAGEALETNSTPSAAQPATTTPTHH